MKKSYKKLSFDLSTYERLYRILYSSNSYFDGFNISPDIFFEKGLKLNKIIKVKISKLKAIRLVELLKDLDGYLVEIRNGEYTLNTDSGPFDAIAFETGNYKNAENYKLGFITPEFLEEQINNLRMEFIIKAEELKSEDNEGKVSVKLPLGFNKKITELLRVIKWEEERNFVEQDFIVSSRSYIKEDAELTLHINPKDAVRISNGAKWVLNNILVDITAFKPSGKIFIFKTHKYSNSKFYFASRIGDTDDYVLHSSDGVTPSDVELLIERIEQAVFWDKLKF